MAPEAKVKLNLNDRNMCSEYVMQTDAGCLKIICIEVEKLQACLPCDRYLGPI